MCRGVYETVRVDIGGQGYPVYVGAGSLDSCGRLLREHGLKEPVCVVGDRGALESHGPRLRKALDGSRIDCHVLSLRPEEESKSLRSFEEVCGFILSSGADRGATVLSFGGGIVGDVAGFAAAVFMRGIALVHIPTTLLAQTDSALGGKCGVNHPLSKNLLGAFHQPRFVLVDPDLLRSLPSSERRAGLFELLKYGILDGDDLFENVVSLAESDEKSVPQEIVARACRIKSDVVSRDPYDRGDRRMLNLGHTFGHALEAVTDYGRFRHGEAVGWGLKAAAQLSVKLGMCTEKTARRIEQAVERLGPLPAIDDLSSKRILEAIRRDKKVLSGSLVFVLPVSVGDVRIVEGVSEEDVESVLVKITEASGAAS